MKKLNELIAERGELVDKMQALIGEIEMLIEEVAPLEGEEAPAEEEEVVEENSQKIDEKRSMWNNYDSKLRKLDEKISMLERQEELNKTNIKRMETPETNNKKPIAVEFRDWLLNAVESGQTATFRADPIITSTDGDMITKTVNPGIDVMLSPGEAWLRELGVTFYPGLTGNFAVPSMAEDMATFPGEDASAASANMLPDSLVLAARRLTHTQSISRETLAQTNPGVYSSILQALNDGIWKAIAYDLFDNLETDAATQETTPTAAGLTYGDIVMMEASIGGLSMGNAAYVTTPSIKAYLKQKALLGTDNGPAWSLDNTLNGYPAYGAPAANANALYFGDWSKAAVGLWGGIEVIVDPYSQSDRGLIKLTVIALADTGITNNRAFCWTNDVSAGL